VVNFFGGSSNDKAPALHNKDAERQDRLQLYQRAWEAYNADLPDPIVIDSPANDNVKVNPIRAMVNTSVYFLFGQEVRFEISPQKAETLGSETDTTNEGTPATNTPDWLKSLNKCWKANRKQSFLNRLGLSGAIHGDVFIKFVPKAAGLNNEFPRLVILDPANVDVEWDPDDCERVTKWSISYTTENEEGEPILQIQEITPDEDADGTVSSWTLQNYRHKMSWDFFAGWFPGPGELVPVGPPETWPYAWAPIEHCQNMELPNQFWGMADVDDTTVDVIQSLQRAMSSVNKVIRIHGSPRMFAKGVLPEQVDEIDVSPDNIITLPGGPDADLSVLQMLSNVKASTDYTDKLREDLYEMLQVPPIALGKISTASMNMSGASLSILYAPILQKTDLKRIPYGDLLDRLNHKFLILLGEETTDTDSLAIIWPEAMPGSQYIERQTLQQDYQMGISMYTVAQRLGYDPETEAARRLKEKTDEINALNKAQLQAQAESGGIQIKDQFPLSPGGDKTTVTTQPPQQVPGQQDGRAPGNNPAGTGGGGQTATGNSTPKSQPGTKDQGPR
jgi:hypothetical protein